MIHKSLIFMVGLSVTAIAAFAAVKYRPATDAPSAPQAVSQTTQQAPKITADKTEEPVEKKVETKVASLPATTKPSELSKPEKIIKPGEQQPEAKTPAAVEKPSVSKQPKVKVPQFDIVEVERDGMALIAGKAAPDTMIKMKLDGKVVGKSRANAQGDWVFVPDSSIPAGSHEIIIEATAENGQTVRSEQSVIISMPEKAGETPLIVIAKADAPTRVLQKPRPESKPAPEPVKTASAVTAAPDTDAAISKQDDIKVPAKTTVIAKTTPSPVKLAAKQPAASGSQKLKFGTVDYNDSGDIVFSGKSAPQKNIRLYVDNKHLGDTVANSTGIWTYKDRRNIKTGEHQLRADTVTSEGKVTERAAVPFFRADKKKVIKLLVSRQDATQANAATPAAAKAENNETTVVIQPGNNLWNIARVIYGEGVAYTTIFEANKEQIRNPDLIFPGQILNTPGVKTSGKIDPERTEPMEKTAVKE